jgi:predicted Fe-Mo cluster-binding NifX family protein
LITGVKKYETLFTYYKTKRRNIMIESLRLAVPSNNPGGLEAGRSDHFGHCDLFTIIDISDGKITEVSTVSNQEHSAGGCMVPVQFLKGEGVQAIVVGGIGARPLQGFAEVGIAVYFADRGNVQDVQAVVSGMIEGKFPIIRPDQACQGHSNCH